MQSTEIRQRFIRFFEQRDHRHLPSSSLVPNDPSLLLTIAGMNQFKPIFLGQEAPEHPRVVTAQKCARTDDIENVGRTNRHMTFFEMLGNFSFGDYFKAGAIDFAYELATETFGLDPERLWATVYLDDDEAVEHWRRVGIPAERIQRRGKEDNYWSMGVAGPCGPCSEMYYDTGRGTEGGPVADEDRYLEFWNLVFMQNVRDDDYRIVGELPRKNIDTGMGLERMAVVLQGVDDVFDTDLLAPIVERAEQVTGRRYRQDPRTDLSLRIVAEHSRSAAFLIADGVLPSNEGRGYVLRRLLRRAARHALLLGTEDLVLPRMTAAVVELLGEPWPELVAQRSLIEQATAAEEESFHRTVRQGAVLLDSAIARERAGGGRRLDGDTAFQLHDTYGFPLELTVEAAEEAGLEVDHERFAALMDEQRQRAKAARAQLGGEQRELEALRDLAARHGGTTFVGYERTAAEARVLALLAGGEELEAAPEGSEVELLLDRSPFFAEGGGQVGDTGTVRTAGGAVLEVLDTVPGPGGLHLHRARVTGGEARAGELAEGAVDAPRRAAVARSHTSTHVVHWALRAALGDHARQQGSLVDAGRLRFDFAHFQAVPPEVLAEVEAAVNRHLVADPEVRVWHASRAEAEAAGAIALFEEKYGAVVRVVDVGDFSRELCGGTHVGHGSQAGPVAVLGESSVGANLRRVEALTGLDALRWYDRERRLLEEVAALLRAQPEQAPEQLRRRLAQLAAAERELERLRQVERSGRAAELATHVATVDGGWLLVERVPGASADDLRQLANAVRERRGGSGVVVLGSEAGGKAALVALLSKDLVAGGAVAREVLAAASRAVGGGAGGKGDLATAGGRDPGKLDDALALAGDTARALLQGGPEAAR